MPLPDQIPIERRPSARLPAGGFRTPASSPAGRSRPAGIRKPFTIVDLDRAVMGAVCWPASFGRCRSMNIVKPRVFALACRPVGSTGQTSEVGKKPGRVRSLFEIVPPVPGLSLMELGRATDRPDRRHRITGASRSVQSITDRTKERCAIIWRTISHRSRLIRAPTRAKPVMPNIPGLGSFAGTPTHSVDSVCTVYHRSRGIFQLRTAP
jgi:hypothetical protein